MAKLLYGPKTRTYTWQSLSEKEMAALSKIEKLYPPDTVFEVWKGRLLFVARPSGFILNAWRLRGDEWVVSWGASPEMGEREKA